MGDQGEGQPSSEESKGEGRKRIGLWRRGLFVGCIVVAGAVAFLADGSTLAKNLGWNTPVNTAGGSSAAADRSADADAAPSLPQLMETRGATEPGTSRIVPETNQVGDCFVFTKDERQQTACDAVHNAQLYALSEPCNKVVLFEFLGGNPGVDVVRRDLVNEESPNGGCTVALPPPLKLSMSLQNVLTGEETDFMRQCYDARRDRDVGCEDVHTAEVVKTEGPGSVTALDCNQAAEVYLGLGRDEFIDQLSVVQRETSLFRRCLVEAKGDNVLTSTLRLVSRSALPIAADDGVRQ